MDRLRYLADAQSAETERDAQCKQKALDIENQQLREELHRQSEATLVLDDLRKEDQRAFAEELHIMRSEAAEKDDCLNALTADLAAAQQRIISLEEGYREDIEKLHAHAKQSKSNLKAKYKKSISTLHQELLSLKARSSEQFQLVDELKHALIDKDQVMKQLESEIVHRANTEAGLRHELIEVSLHNEKRMAEMAVSKEKESANFIRSLLKEKEELEAEVKLLRGLHSKQSVDNSSQTTDADSNEMERLLSELTGRAAELEQENESLRALVRQMREEMERVSAEAVGPQRNYFYQEALSANEQVQQLSVLLAKKQSLIDSLLSEKAETPKQTGEVDAQFKLNEVISDLRRRCNQAAAENATLKAERVKLIDISNFLRAELREAVKPLHQSATVGTQTLVRRSASTDPTPQIVQQRAPTLEQQKRPPARTAASFGSNRTPSPDKAMEEEKARRARGLRNWNVKEDI
ncbi:hypothetical protein DFJ73DRAFT_817697 [Zopfochytrium polystomum]|nr:hypothetical protein DFJ73DRAFT_817697 [Zopfochytrium polystomum]